MGISREEKELLKKQNEEIKRQQQLIREQYNKMLVDEDNRRKQPKLAPENVYISLQNINKVYDNYVQAVFDFNLDIQEHELIVFVGPSGCGKSTTLRMVAGLEEITTGDLYIDGVYCNEKTAKERDIAMVFQNYALYPHMTVYENLAFGLQTRKYSKEEIDERVKRAAEILQITEYLQRRPKELSGGQMQRVALGRAIVREAKVFLMAASFYAKRNYKSSQKNKRNHHIRHSRPDGGNDNGVPHSRNEKGLRSANRHARGGVCAPRKYVCGNLYRRARNEPCRVRLQRRQTDF